MSQQDRTGLLKAFLGGLPGAAAGRLAMAVEMDRLMDGHVLPHDAILEGLRPVLRREHYDRTPTPLRLFCRPFQDLLTCVPRIAGKRPWPRMSRTGRGTACATSCTITRMPNSISRERLSETSVRSADIRAAR